MVVVVAMAVAAVVLLNALVFEMVGLPLWGKKKMQMGDANDCHTFHVVIEQR